MFIRRHPTPNPSNFDGLLKAAAKLGLKLNVENSKALAESLDSAQVSIHMNALLTFYQFPEDPYINTLLRILTTRCMTQAVYFSSGTVPYDQFLHYGLAAPIYTHFTSPIRRYAGYISPLIIDLIFIT